MKKTTKILYGSILSILILAILIILIIQHIEKTDKIIWNSATESLTTDFIVGKNGLFYLRAKVNNVSGLYLFDTGCMITAVNEKIVTNEKMKSHRYTVSYANGDKQTKNLYKVGLFELGTVGIKKLKVFPKDTASWTDPQGDYYKQDSIHGTIGNNIISKFIWDFDLVNLRVTISNTKNYSKKIPDSLAINLLSKNNIKEIPVLINNVNKNLILDFGCSSPILLSDSIQNQEISKNKKNLSQGTNISSNHLINNIDFANIQLGSYAFNEIKCIKNDHLNLFGIPFIWAFERVVLDFNKNKVYFISKSNNERNYSIDRYKRNYIKANSTINMKSKPSGLKFTIGNNSTIRNYKIFGNIKLYRSNNKLDSILCIDSLRMPNGQIKFGPTMLRTEQTN